MAARAETIATSALGGISRVRAVGSIPSGRAAIRRAMLIASAEIYPFAELALSRCKASKRNVAAATQSGIFFFVLETEIMLLTANTGIKISLSFLLNDSQISQIEPRPMATATLRGNVAVHSAMSRSSPPARPPAASPFHLRNRGMGRHC